MPGNSIYDAITCERQDVLERRYLAERIFNRLISDACPAVMGIYGSWGTGKTSLLNLIHDKWENSGKHILQLEYIDAWNYEGSSTLFVPIIVRMMSKRISGMPDLAEYFKRASLMALYLGSDLALRTLTGNGLDDLRRYETDMHDSGLTRVSVLDWEKFTDKVEETKAAFSTLIGRFNQEQNSRRVVFMIDNLDRCSPENVVSLLESIKNFLSVDGCTWIFAMDSEVVASYISQKYAGTKMDGNSYLDKIIPEQYHLSFYPEQNDRRVFNLICETTGMDLALNNEMRLPQVPRVLVPRRLKKTAAKFSEYFDGKQPDADQDTIFLLILLYHTWPEFYGRLSSPSLTHVGGVLANFFKEDGCKSWGDYSSVPMISGFADDLDLLHFLRIAFPEYRDGDHVAQEIHRAVNALREIGLP